MLLTARFFLIFSNCEQSSLVVWLLTFVLLLEDSMKPIMKKLAIGGLKARGREVIGGLTPVRPPSPSPLDGRPLTTRPGRRTT